MRKLVLHSYFRSSAAYRVRIALNIKALPYETRSVDLLLSGGQQHLPAFRAINPQGLVPVLVHGEQCISQSLAIIEYLEEIVSTPALLPGSAMERAYVRALAQMLACDVHPLQNLRVRQYLALRLQQSKASVVEWQRYWIEEGLRAFEGVLVQRHLSGTFCFGDQPSLADICLVPQLYNAARVGCDLSSLPTIRAIEQRCLDLPAFVAAAPESQPDAA